MASPKPPWDRTPQAPGNKRPTTRERMDNYGPSTPETRAEAAGWIARDLAMRRRKRISLVSRASGGLNVYDKRQLIGTADGEDGPIHRVKPRSLGVRGMQ